MSHTKGKLPELHGVFDSSRNIYCLVGKDQDVGLSGQEIDKAAHRCNCHDDLLAACEESEEAKHSLEKIVAYCKTDDETYGIAEDIMKMILPKLSKAKAALTKANKDE